MGNEDYSREVEEDGLADYQADLVDAGRPVI